MLQAYARRIVALDVDDVLLDLVTPWVEKYAGMTGHGLTKADIHSWDMAQYVLPEWRQFFYGLRTPSIYWDMQAVTGAQGGVQALLRQGHTLVAITYDHTTHVKAKVRRLHELFPQIEHIVFAKEKRATLHFDLLIDDGAHNAPDMLFTQPWNVGLDAYPGVRVTGWHDIVHRLGVC